MPHGSVFHSRRNQLIRLPKESTLPDGVKRVEVISVGRTRIIPPVGESWDSWFDEPSATADFMNTREQPEDQRREAF
ncbi:type II toxin-antitoxin system VapB family antitoxin [Chromohalobacter sp. 48-RD10]|uniref:type II toxin-antitoxin system VapB family antitoxin n=1 Tax=Chromohalobacter sp. 48-RD10 TaxID=2994063 RepID=UPI0024690472|nr:type II toxin-antitoxin system VapB family antitoxin [Chromohalobacter sp. 48-RD10]